MARILVTEEIAEGGLDRLRADGHEVDVRLGLSPDELLAVIPGAHALIIRSSTDVTDAVLAAGSDLIAMNTVRALADRGISVPGDIAVTGEVLWYASSARAQRGRCPRCGSCLFWMAHDETTTSFALGAIEGPTGLRLEKHIFVADKGDYYDIADDLPQRP